MEIQLHLYMCVCVCVCVFACGCNACVTTKAIRVFLQAHAKPIATEKWLILLLQFWEMKKKKEWCDASSDKSAHQYSYDWMIHPRQKRSGRMFSMVWHSSSSCRIGRVSELFQWKQIWILCDLFKWIGVRCFCANKWSYKLNTSSEFVSSRTTRNISWGSGKIILQVNYQRITGYIQHIFFW